MKILYLAIILFFSSCSNGDGGQNPRYKGKDETRIDTVVVKKDLK